MDLGETIAPNSDQLDAVDLLAGPRDFTVEKVSKGNAEQPVQIHLAEFPRVYRPGKSMRRVLVAAWGRDGAQYVGRRMRLWCDPKVSFGGQAVGGVRILALSHIGKAVTTPLLVTRGKSAMYTVEPLAEDPTVALNAAKRRVAALAPDGVDLKAWVAEQLSKRPALDGTNSADLIKLAEELELAK